MALCGETTSPFEAAAHALSGNIGDAARGEGMLRFESGLRQK